MISKSRRSGSVLLTLFFLPGTLFLTSRKKSPTLSCVVNPALSEPMPANVPRHDTEFHNNSCRNRNCPKLPGCLKRNMGDNAGRKSLMHRISCGSTLPHELNPAFIYCNQKLLYVFFTDAVPKHSLNYLYDKKYLGVTPGIIQVLHTWNQEIGYHVYALYCFWWRWPYDKKIRRSKTSFSFLSGYSGINLKGNIFPSLIPCTGKDRSFLFFRETLRNSYEWKEFKIIFTARLVPYIKKTFNGFGNAPEYLWTVYP